MIKKVLVSFIATSFVTAAWAIPIIDPDVQALINKAVLKSNMQQSEPVISVIVFLRSMSVRAQFIADIERIPHVKIQEMQSLPALFISLPQKQEVLERIINHPGTAQISSLQGGHEELENSEQAILLRPSSFYPNISNWWDDGYTGHQGVLGLIDSGVAPEHPSLQGKNIIIRKEPGSGYAEHKNGVRSPHGTGVACIYAAEGNNAFPNDSGIAYQTPTIVAGLAGEGDGNFEDIGQTLSTLDWMLNRNEIMPNVINYSFGNGPISCKTCTDWSGLAHVVDYVVNHYKILWVKSAGNLGYIESSSRPPYASTMTAPADNYNGLTVANMNPAVLESGKWKLSPERNKHYIRFTSSRGPTLSGRKKPDSTAPGNDTSTCAPDPATYSFNYTPAMDYHDGYRLMGGTSSAAPHVGASLLLLHDAGIVEPIAQKALLINSADAWADNDIPGPDDIKQPRRGEHYPIQGSQWNRTYGWGYLNMQKAYEQRNNLVISKLTAEHPQQSYIVDLPVGAKITLVHERRVGYGEDHVPWKLSHVSLDIVDTKTQQIIAMDDSAQDTVHQVANCKRIKNERQCSENTALIHAIVNVKLLNKTIDGNSDEPFALVMSVSFEGHGTS